MQLFQGAEIRGLLCNGTLLNQLQLQRKKNKNKTGKKGTAFEIKNVSYGVTKQYCFFSRKARRFR